MNTAETKLIVWGVMGWDVKHGRYEVLAYATETKAEAYAKCAELHPTIDIERVYKIADY